MKYSLLNGFASILFALALVGCGGKPVNPTPKPGPSISIENKAFTVKVGKSVTISPTYTNADGATIQWVLDGKVIATTRNLAFSSNTPGI
ncbi:MAG: hypothetical protein IK041_06860, partial [Bacteroidales bacterium]|nr:hypothetical protein [Bacteroidales bacterium]